VTRRPYTQQRISNYEGFKRLDQTLEKIETGVLKAPGTHAKENLCRMCKRWKMTQVAYPSRLMGTPLKGSKLRGTFILVCQECADEMRGRKVQ
jgi:hypothetical protein